MKASVALAWAGSGLFLIGLTAFSMAQDRAQPEGARPYTPTRLEWLAVELNAQLRREMTTAPESAFSMAFAHVEKDDAILIYVTYLPSVDREIMNKALDTARSVIAIESKSRAWTSWLKVQEHIEMKELK